MAEVLNRKNKQEQHSSGGTEVKKIREMELNMWQMLGWEGAGHGGGESKVQGAGRRNTTYLGGSEYMRVPMAIDREVVG